MGTRRWGKSRVGELEAHASTTQPFRTACPEPYQKTVPFQHTARTAISKNLIKGTLRFSGKPGVSSDNLFCPGTLSWPATHEHGSIING